MNRNACFSIILLFVPIWVITTALGICTSMCTGTSSRPPAGASQDVPVITTKSCSLICAFHCVDLKLSSNVRMHVYCSHWSHFSSLFSPQILLLTYYELKSETYWSLVIILKVIVSKSLKSKILESKYYMIIQIWVFFFFLLRLKQKLHRRKVFMCLALGLSSSISALDYGHSS